MEFGKINVVRVNFFVMPGILAVEFDVATDCFSDFFKLSRLEISGFIRKSHGNVMEFCFHKVVAT